jgi:Fe-S-cluster containining protein
MFTQISTLFSFVDETVKNITRDYPDEVRCRPGCADCCHATFDISFIEAAYIASFLAGQPSLLQQQHRHALAAAHGWEELVARSKDPATTRIRCPLLSEDRLCLGHEVRPVNCRTYGTPTVINGKAHVCGLSRFSDRKRYPTIDLAPLQTSLYRYSTELAGIEVGGRRFPVAWIFLKTDYFLPKSQPQRRAP